MTASPQSNQPPQPTERLSVKELTRRKSSTLSFYMEQQKINQSTIQLLKQYDTNGDGQIDTQEVSQIVLDLRMFLQHNQRLDQDNSFWKQLVCGMIVFAIVLLSGLFALSYAATRLSQQVDVTSSTAVLMVKDSSTQSVQTDSHSTTFFLEPLVLDNNDNDNNTTSSSSSSVGPYCLTPQEYMDMEDLVLSGRHVLIQFAAANDTDTSSSLSVQEIQAAGMDMDTETDKTCFTLQDGSGRRLCFTPSEECPESTTTTTTTTTTTGRRSLLRNLQKTGTRGILIDYE